MKTLGDVIKIETGEQLNKSDMLPDAEHPVVNGGIDFSGYTDKYNSEANTITISQGGASAGYVNWLDMKFWAGAHCYVVTPLPDNDVRFLYHFIKSREYNFMKNQQGAGIPSLNRSEVYKTAFPDFDYNKQKEIAEILDSFTSLITNLETELASRQKQYEYYRNKLLTFDENDEGVDIKTLGEVCEIRNGYTPSKSNPNFWEDGVIPWFRLDDIRQNGRILNDAIQHITHEAVKKGIPFKANSVIVSTTATIGEHALIEVPFVCNQQITVLTPNNKLLPKYLYYQGYGIGQWCKANVNGAGLAIIPTSRVGDCSICIPSVQRQQEIVSTLDTFESLISNIKQELDARKKQYEYYREKLLTFE